MLYRYQFGELLNQAWSQAATVHNGVSGFRACGIYPCSKNAIPHHAYALAEHQTGNSQEEVEHVDAENSDQHSGDVAVVNFDDIAPIPSIPGPSKPNVRKQHAEVLTSPDYRQKKRQKIEEKQKKQQGKAAELEKKLRKKGNKKKKNVVHDSSSEEVSGDENIVSDHSSDEPDSDKDDFCAICDGFYFDKKGPKVDWICCVVCKKWLHETCASGPNMCDPCAKITK